jgi:GNAT superfamily N-acetyltransferase
VTAYAIRPVASLAELERTFDLLGAQVTPPRTHEHRSFADLARAYPADRPIMLVVEHAGEVVGGALAFRTGDESGAVLRILAVVADHRGRGVGRLAMEALESEAVKLGIVTMSLGAVPEAHGFYLRMGYTGRSRMHKSLAGAGATRYGDAAERQRRLAELRARRGARA